MVVECTSVMRTFYPEGQKRVLDLAKVDDRLDDPLTKRELTGTEKGTEVIREIP